MQLTGGRWKVTGGNIPYCKEGVAGGWQGAGVKGQVTGGNVLYYDAVYLRRVSTERRLSLLRMVALMVGQLFTFQWLNGIYLATMLWKV